MENQTQSKIVAVTDFEKATKHTWLVTKIPGVHPASSKGYGDGQIFYSLMETGHEAASHDLYALKRDTDVGMTDAEFEFLQGHDFDALTDGESYEV